MPAYQLFAQTDSAKVERGKLYSVSGIGFGFTSGAINDVLKPKFSSNIGLDIEVGKGPVFLYTNFDFLSLKYNQLNKTTPGDFKIENGNSTFYIFTLAPGYRKQLGKISIYGFVGPGIGLVSEPRVIMEEDIAVIKNEYNFTATGRGGIGIDYYLGRTLLFIEGGYLHNFRKIEDRNVNIIPVFVGLKSDISGIFKIFKRTSFIK
jgi:hypothetical protein